LFVRRRWLRDDRLDIDAARDLPVLNADLGAIITEG